MPNSRSVLVLAPVGRDAELLARSLEGAGMHARALADVPALLAAAGDPDTGALAITAEALSAATIHQLADILQRQPHWSELPLLVLVPGGVDSRTTVRLENALRSLPNVTLLERPIRQASFASAARAALHSRARQHEVRRTIEERDRATATLIESEKLAAVGRLAASIAHEINNPLESVTNLLFLIAGDPTLSAETREFVTIAERELLRASHIVQQNLRFHRQATRPVPVTGEALLEPVLAIYGGRLVNAGIEVLTRFRDGTAIICYDGEIRQVLSNLIGNAIDAMRTGGRLFLRVRTVRTVGGEGVAFTVADTGEGMALDTVRRIFEAFYTTKGIGGTGLGLWISSEIVRKHGGRLHVRSCQGSGTVFRLFLPTRMSERS